MLSYSIAVVLAVARIAHGSAARGGSNSTAPIWPEQFRATLLQNRSNELALVTLYYDNINGRNYNIVRPQMSPTEVMFDLEYANGTTFYWFPGKSSCGLIQMPVGLLRPTWIRDSGRYIGVENVDGFRCDSWNTSNGFAVYYADHLTRLPIYWRFGSGAEFHVLEFEPGVSSPVIQPTAQCKPGEATRQRAQASTSRAWYRNGRLYQRNEATGKNARRIDK